MLVATRGESRLSPAKPSREVIRLPSFMPAALTPTQMPLKAHLCYFLSLLLVCSPAVARTPSGAGKSQQSKQRLGDDLHSAEAALEELDLSRNVNSIDVPGVPGLSDAESFQRSFTRKTGLAWTSFTASYSDLRALQLELAKAASEGRSLDRLRADVDNAFGDDPAKQDARTTVAAAVDRYTAARDAARGQTAVTVAHLAPLLDNVQAFVDAVGKLGTAAMKEARTVTVAVSWEQLNQIQSVVAIDDQKLKGHVDGLWAEVDNAYADLVEHLDRYQIGESSPGRLELSGDREEQDEHRRKAEEAFTAAASVVGAMVSSGLYNPYIIALAAFLFIYGLFELGKSSDSDDGNGGSQSDSADNRLTPVPAREKGPKPSKEVLATVASNGAELDWNAKIGGNPRGIPFAAAWEGTVLRFVFAPPGRAPIVVGVDMSADNRDAPGGLSAQLREVERGARNCNLVQCFIADDAAGDPDDVIIRFELEGIIPKKPVDSESGSDFPYVEMTRNGKVLTPNF